MKAAFVTTWVDGWGFKPAIVFQGRTRLSAVIITPRVVVVHLPLESIVKEFADYPLKKAARKFRAIARKHGQTKEARALLKTVT